MVQTLASPDLSDANILRFVGGVRPCRRGGLRIEAERLGADAGSKLVVHNYGHGGCGVTIGFGTADEAMALVDAHSEPDAPVAVLGAGVVGLTTAIRLLERGRRVRVVAEKLGTDTVSTVAGAVWLPTGIEFGETPDRVAWFHGILRRSFSTLKSLDARFGVEELPVFEPENAPDEPGFFDHGTIEAPTMLERLPIGVKEQPGRVYRTLFIHTPKFLRALIAEARRLGGTFEMRRIGRLGELADLPEPVLVNCLALGSRTLFDDRAMYPARGMLVLMKPQSLGYIAHDGYKYMFPREDALVLGGCFLEGDDRAQPDEAYCREILRHHRTFFGQA